MNKTAPIRRKMDISLQILMAVSLCLLISAPGLAQDEPVIGSTVVLTPAAVVDFALNGNVSMQTSRYSLQIDDLSRKSAFAAMLPVLKGKGSFVHFDKQPMTGGLSPNMMSGIPDSSLNKLDNGDIVVLEILKQAFDGMGASRPVGVQDMWNLGFTFTQPFFAGGRLANAFKLADQNHSITSLRQERIKQEVRMRALQLFWSYVGKRQNMAVLEDNIVWLEQLNNDQVALAENGMITEDDVLRTKTALGFAKLTLVMAKDSLQDLQEMILLHCNLPSTTVLLIDTLSLVDLDREVAVPDPSNISVVDSRKDIQALYRQVKTLGTVKNIQMGAYAPNLFGMYGYDWRNTDPYNPHDMRGGWNVGVALDWSIWDWMGGWREVEKTAIRIAQMKLALDAQVESIRAEARRSARAVATSIEVERLSLESLDNAQRALDHTELRYHEGLITSQDLLGARKDLTEARQRLIGSRIGKVLAVEGFRTATGGE